MAYLDTTYTNGVIAAREKRLLKEKLYRLCELSAEEGFRALLDSGFGGGAETATSVYDFEKLVEKDEADIDAFIREYAPSEAEQAYLLSPRDFHNAKALVKAKYLNRSVESMLAPNGLIEKETLEEGIKSGDYSKINAFNAYLGRACEETDALLAEEPSGSKVGEIFEKAKYEYLFDRVKRKPVIKKLLLSKADMTNILIAFRAGDEETALKKYLPFGILKAEDMHVLFSADEKEALERFAKTPYISFVKACLEAREKKQPFTEAEKLLSGFDAAYFTERKYELKKSEPFLYYVYRRRLENANVRVVFVCLLAGLSEQEVKKRIRRY